MPPLSNQEPSLAASPTSGEHLIADHSVTDGTPPSKGGGVLRTIIIFAVVLGAIGFVVWKIHANNEATAQEGTRAMAAANRPTPVQVANVQVKTVPVFLTALGTVTAYNTVTLHTRVDGQLLQVNFTEGQAVRKGQLLLQIDPNPYQAAVDQAIGNLAKDEANLKNMQAEAERYTALYESGVVSKEQQQLEVSNLGQAQGSIKADQAAIEAAKVNLAYTKIYSPIDGIVGLRQVDPGNIVHAADTTGLVVITQIHPIAVIFTLPEDQLPQVQKALKGGNKLSVEAYDRSDSHLIATGSLLTIDNQIDTTTGTAKLKAVFDNADNSLFANQFVNVRLILSQRQNATVVPTAAISTGTQGDYVFVVNQGPTPKEKMKNLPNAGAAGASGRRGTNGGSGATGAPAASQAGAPGASGATGSNGKPREQLHVDTVTVHVDFTIGTNSVLSDGALHEGQRVVVDGQEKLVDGSPVSIPQTGARGASGASGSMAPQPNTGSTGASGSTGGLNPDTPTPGNHQHAKGGGSQ